MSRIEKIMVIEPNMTRNMEENDEDIRIVLEYVQNGEDIRKKEI